MRYCKKCNTQMEDDEIFCANCGTKYEESKEQVQIEEPMHEEVQEAVQENQPESKDKHKKKMITWSIIVICFIAIGTLGYFVIYPKVTQYIDKQKNQEKADRIINLIESVTSDEIVIDSEKDLDSAKLEYNSLSDEQKALVENYGKLEEAYTELDKLKEEKVNQEKAKSVIDAIEAVEPDSLTDIDTSIQKIRAEYESLTEEQKKLVTNVDKLEEYEAIVQQKKELKLAEEGKEATRSSKQQKLLNMFSNLNQYEGTWGDFGAHINEYQGMVEATIKSSISLSDYFGGDINYVYMSLRKVVDNDNALMYGANTTNQHYLIRFEGLNPNETGMYRTLDCMVDSSDGVNLVYREQSYY